MALEWAGGRTLVDLVQDVERATERAAHEMSDKAVERMQEVVKRNTPVEHFFKRIGERHLREMIDKKATLVFDSVGATVYHSGVETHVEYAPYVEHGTGLWGPRHAKYEIKPKTPGGTLAWPDRHTGKMIFAKRVMHPGSPGAHMFAIGVAVTEHEFDRIVKPALDRWEHDA